MEIPQVSGQRRGCETTLLLLADMEVEKLGLKRNTSVFQGIMFHFHVGESKCSVWDLGQEFSTYEGLNAW